MKLHVIDTGFFKLDGGAMFGVVPKSIWNKLNPADERNLCSWAMRCLLIETENRLILVDTGMGNKQDPRFLSFYYLHGDDSLDKSIRSAGYSNKDITDVFLTHLHFDHCGGAIIRKDQDTLGLAFENAVYWSNQSHWDWAVNPNPREKASFLKENIQPIKESGHLKFIEPGSPSPFPGFDIMVVDGHTEKQMLPVISYKGKKIAFMGDLIPSIGHIPVSYVMAYDVRPLKAIEEKEQFLKKAADEGYILFFEHDPVNQCCTVQHTDKGVRVKDTFPLNDIL